MSDLSETGPIEVNMPTKSRYGQRRCTAHKKNGERCKNAARLGGTVCGFHGGRAPAVIAKARERLALAADRMARELLGIATGAESEAVKLAAVKDALDRAGLGAKAAVELSVAEPKPWEDVLSDITGIAGITRDESRARRGLPPANAPALPPPPPALEALDVEAVEAPPSSTASHADDADRGDTATPPFTEPSGPPTAPGLTTLEEAVTSARVVRVRRVR